MKWYNPEYMGTVADWIGILATVLTIFLTIRYYMNDNRRSFKIVFYPLNWKDSEHGVEIYSSQPQSFEFYAVNFSKNVDAVYFYTIVSKASWVSKRIFGIPVKHLDWDFSFGQRVPQYQNIGPRKSTKKETFNSHWFYDHALDVYMDTKRKKCIKHIKLAIVYVNVEGKKFSRTVVFHVEDLLKYKKEKQNNKDSRKLEKPITK